MIYASGWIAFKTKILADFKVADFLIWQAQFGKTRLKDYCWDEKEQHKRGHNKHFDKISLSVYNVKNKHEHDYLWL